VFDPCLLQVLLRKNSLQWNAMLRGFSFKPSDWKTPATRWAYISRILRILSDVSYVAKLQQLLMYILQEGGRDIDAVAVAAADIDDAAEGADDVDEVEEDDDDEAIAVAPAVKAARDRKRLNDTEALLQLLLDPKFHVRVQAAFVMIGPMRSANAKLQTDTMSSSVMIAFDTAADSLAALAVPATRIAGLAQCESMLQRATQLQPAPVLTATVLRTADGEFVVTHQVPPLLYLRGYAGLPSAKNAAAKRDWAALVTAPGSVASAAAAAGIAVYDKWMRPLWNHAEQRNCASLYNVSQVYLDGVEFEAMLDNESTSLPRGVDINRLDAPYPWKWNAPVARIPPAIAAVPAVVGHAAEAAHPPLQPEPDVDFEDAMPANLAQTTKQRLLRQWIDFKAHCRPPALIAGAPVDGHAYIDSDRYDYNALTNTVILDADGNKVSKLSAWYWIRTRPFFPDLSELMLFWLCAPVSTAGLERGFSFQTMIDQDTRRRSVDSWHMRDDMLVHIHRHWFNERLVATL
jgi:hypothetical protein